MSRVVTLNVSSLKWIVSGLKWIVGGLKRVFSIVKQEFPFPAFTLSRHANSLSMNVMM